MPLDGTHRAGTMSLSTRTFVIDQADCLYRLPRSKFSTMLSSPNTVVIPKFASQRIRAAEASVELINRLPSRVIRTVFFMLEFDARGALRTDSLMAQAAAAIDTTLTGLSPGEGNVIDARGRFIAGGGRWKPTPAQRKLITGAALGKMRCPSV